MHDSHDAFDSDYPIGAPPVAPEDYDLVEPPGWPKGVGVTSIVLGSLGLTCGLGGLGMAAFQKQMLSLMPSEMQQYEMPPSASPDMLDYTLMGIAPLVSVLLLTAGIMTAMRSINGRYAHLAYGLIKLVLIGVGIWIGLENLQADIAWRETQPADNPFAQGNSSTDMLGPIAVIGMSLMFAIWPIFSLVWFGVVKTKPEDFTGGVEPVA